MSSVSASVVVACNSRSSSNDQAKVNQIKNKIQNTEVNIEKTDGLSLNANDYRDAINTNLISNNEATGLNANDVANINYSGTLKTDERVTIDAIIAINNCRVVVPINVELAENDSTSMANAIAGKITEDNLVVSQQTNPNISLPQTQTTFKQALRDANASLTANDLATMQYRGNNLQKGVASELDLNINVNGSIVRKPISALIANSDQQQAQAIRDKIVTTSGLEVPPDTNPNASNQDTERSINTALRAQNPGAGLTNGDLAKITYSGTLQKGSAVNLQGSITFGTTPPITFQVSVSLAQSDLEVAEAIKQEISQPNLVLPALTNGTVAANQSAIFDKLVQENPGVGPSINRINFNNPGQNLTPGVNNVVTAQIKVNDAIVSVDLTITLNETFSKTNLTNTSSNSPTKIGNRIYDTTFRGLYYTTNGTTWNKIGQFTGIRNQIVYMNNTYYVAALGNTTKGLYQSADGLDNWTKDTFTDAAGSTSTDVTISSAVNFVNNTYYVGVNTGSSGLTRGLYSSKDGTNWTQVAGAPQDIEVFQPPQKVAGAPNKLYLATNLGLYVKDLDSATSPWVRNSSLKKPDGTPLNVSEPPQKIGTTWYIATELGLWTSSNGENWEQTAIAGLKDSFIENPIEYDPSTQTYFVTTVPNPATGQTNSGLWESKNGVTWNDTIIGKSELNTKILQNPVDINGLYYLATDYGLYTSRDAQNWTFNNSFGVGDLGEKFDHPPVYINDPKNPLIDAIYLGGFEMWRLQ